jgi:hypothetical protein
MRVARSSSLGIGFLYKSAGKGRRRVAGPTSGNNVLGADPAEDGPQSQLLQGPSALANLKANLHDKVNTAEKWGAYVT